MSLTWKRQKIQTRSCFHLWMTCQKQIWSKDYEQQGWLWWHFREEKLWAENIWVVLCQIEEIQFRVDWEVICLSSSRSTRVCQENIGKYCNWDSRIWRSEGDESWNSSAKGVEFLKMTELRRYSIIRAWNRGSSGNLPIHAAWWTGTNER